MEVIVANKPGLPLVSFALLAWAGATGDPAELPGLSSFTASMMDEGTTTRTSQEISAAFEHIGSRLGTEARKELTLLTAETLDRHWRHALGLAAGRGPATPASRSTSWSGYDGNASPTCAGPATKPVSWPIPISARWCSGRSRPMPTPIWVNEATVSAVQRADMLARHKQCLRPDRLCLLVAGDVGVDEAVAAAEERFGDWRAPAEAAAGIGANGGSAAGGPRIYLIDKPGAAQSVIRAGMPLVERSHADFMALSVLNYAFGGQFSARLNQNLRQDKGYSYGYNSGISWYNAPSLLSAGGSVQTAVTREAVFETLREFEDISCQRPLTDEELENARNGLRLGYPAGFERPAQLLGQLMTLAQFGLPDDYFRTFEERLAGVSLTDTHRVGAEYLSPDRLTVLVVGDREQVEEPLRELGYGLTLLDAEGAVMA